MNETITFGSLAYTDIQSVLDCFNGSFIDYFIPFQLTKETLADKIYAEAIDLKLSYGAFDREKLVGLILHGIDTFEGRIVAFNAGTGVLPAYRGRKLSQSLYEYALRDLKAHGIDESLLEVFVQNIQAIKTYERCGFISTRKLVSYKGDPVCTVTEDHSIEVLTHPDWQLIHTLRGWRPSWQYNDNTLKRSWNNYTMLVAKKEDGIAGYCIANLNTGRIAHFGSKEGNNDSLDALFKHVSEHTTKPLSVAHIDEKATQSITFLQSLGMEPMVTCFEMELKHSQKD